MKRLRFTVVALLLFMCSTVLLAQAPIAGTKTDPLLGNWKLNLEKSTYSPGPKPAAGTISIRRYEVLADGSLVTKIVGVSPQGVPTFSYVVHKFDGKDYSQHSDVTMTTGTKPATQSYRIIDAYTTERTTKDATGKVTSKNIRAVSKDGKSYTESTTGTNAQGQPVKNVLVFERVQ